MPRERVGLAIGRDSRGHCQAVVAMSTYINPTQMRDLAYLIGREVGSALEEEEHAQLHMKFKGKQVVRLSADPLRQAWNEFHRYAPTRNSLYALGSATDVPKEIARAISEYMHLPETPAVPERDPDLPDNVFISANVPL